jgi:hypothetical protein
MKKVKQYHYAYLVENKWRKAKSSCRQKVKQYLGRVHNLESNGLKFDSDISDLDFKETVMKLVEFELVKNGFEKRGSNLLKDGLIVDIKNMKFQKQNKNIIFEANEGFLCEFTLNKLMNFKARGHEEKVGFDLANALLEAGLAVPQEIFINIFDKVYKKKLINHL